MAEHTPLRTVGLLARAVTARARQAHAARALCGAIASGALVLACIVRSGGSVEDPEALILAVVVGTLAFFAWRRSRSVSVDTIARRVDAAIGLRGAFVAAFEADRARATSPLAQLGAARLALVLRRSDAMESAIPHTVGFIALPLFALTGLALAVGARDAAERSAADAALQSLTLSANLASLAKGSAASLDDIQRDLLEQAAKSAAAAATRSGEQQKADMRDVAAELDALAREVPPGSELADALARAAAEAEAVALDVGGDDDATDVLPGEGRDAGSDAESNAESNAAVAAPDADLARAGADSGASDPDAGDPTSAEPSASGAGAVTSDGDPPSTVDPSARGDLGPDPPGARANREPEASAAEERTSRTVGEVRWWSERDAGIVSRWAASRSSREGSPPSGSNTGG